MDIKQGDTVTHTVWGTGQVHLVDTATNLVGVHFPMAGQPDHWVHPVTLTVIDEYRAVPIPGQRTKYYVYDTQTGERVAILEDGDARQRGWSAWSWEDGTSFLMNENQGESLESIVRRADEWIA